MSNHGNASNNKEKEYGRLTTTNELDKKSLKRTESKMEDGSCSENGNDMSINGMEPNDRHCQHQEDLTKRRNKTAKHDLFVQEKTMNLSPSSPYTTRRMKERK